MDFKQKLIAEFDRETASTRKMLEAVPADADFNYKPHEKSMVFGRLLGHLSDTAGDWAVHTLTVDKLEFPEGHKFEQYVPASKEAMLAQFDKQVAEAKAALVAQLGSEPHDPSSRTGWRVSSLAGSEDSWHLRPFGRWDVADKLLNREQATATRRLIRWPRRRLSLTTGRCPYYS